MLTAVFADDPVLTVLSANETFGTVSGSGQFKPNLPYEISASVTIGYHFTQWNDSNTYNPRTIVLTRDTTFTAQFAQTFSGQCGDNLYWSYEGHTLTITGTGAMYDYAPENVPWLLFRDTTTAVVLESGITHIGTYTFAVFAGLRKIELPSTITTIGANAFAGTSRLYDIYCYAINPPYAETSSFANYEVYLYVPCDNLYYYQRDAVFGSFENIQCMAVTDIEQVPTDTADTATPQKVLIDGQIYILRNGKIYTTTAVEVK